MYGLGPFLLITCKPIVTKRMYPRNRIKSVLDLLQEVSFQNFSCCCCCCLGVSQKTGKVYMEMKLCKMMESMTGCASLFANNVVYM